MQRISKVFTLMGAILALAFGLASCKANVDDDPTMYTVTVSSSIEHGKVSVDKTSAEAGATVKLTATADSGYELDSYSVKDASVNELTVTDGTFTMPKSNVTVSATFKETAETVNQKAAAAVIAKINAIGTVEYTDESKAKIDEACTAYGALTETQKALIPAETLAVLTNAESTYGTLKAAAEQQTATYTVTLTGGANATISGGNTTQEGLSDAMETVTFTANDGYYFEDFTDITSNGITATRTSDSVVTVSGTPTGNASITIPDATEQQATTYSITLTGPYTNFTLVMEYQEGDTWNDMATKYPDYIKIYSGYVGFHTDGLIQDKATGKKVSSTDVIDPNKTYEIQ